MRKVLWAFAVALVLAGPAVFAEEAQFESNQSEAASLRTDAPEEGDMCRQECADDGADPDECQMDCNTVA